MSILVSDVMSREVQSVQPDLTLFDLERALIQSRIGGAPVVQRGELVGVVSRTDILRRLLAAQELRDYAEFEHRRTVSGLDVPLHELLGTAERVFDPGIEAQLRLLRVADIMSEHPITVAASAPLETAARLMLENRIHRVIAVQARQPVGILTALDVVRHYCGPVP
jgi:CBS domain-containing protein